MQIIDSDSKKDNYEIAYDLVELFDDDCMCDDSYTYTYVSSSKIFKIKKDAKIYLQKLIDFHFPEDSNNTNDRILIP